MTRLVRYASQRTFPACRCGSLMDLVVLPANHDVAGSSFFLCRSCGAERDKLVERIVLPDLSPRLEIAPC